MAGTVNVLSLFDGMSCGQIALNRCGIKYDNYFASEIDEPAIKVTQSNYPDTIQLGSVVDIKGSGLPGIDLLIGGSPCQDISNLAKFKLGLDGSKSSLFYQYWRMWQETNPKYFLLENVAGNKSAIEQITKLMGVKPIKISSSWVSAQTRMRLYWTNIPVNSLPVKKNVLLQDILQDNVDEKYYLNGSRLNWLNSEGGKFSRKKRFIGIDTPRVGCLTRRGDASWNCTYVTQNNKIRKLTPVEWERLQTVPDNYTSAVEDKHRYEMLGNGWTVDIITHIFKHMKQ